MTAKPLLEKAQQRFNQRACTDLALRSELEGMTKRVYVDLGTEKYNFELKECSVPSINDGPPASPPDITIASDPETLDKIVSGELKIMKAWALRKIRIKGSLDDIMRLRKFL
ncbi:MAG TPA: SCP2 sterol-binding domain-containing protein [Methanomassiliicoccales archaeon]|nr:SCP2 sterol-binding domain-containing protein [Methanomassiliicoccales archaeon]